MKGVLSKSPEVAQSDKGPKNRDLSVNAPSSQSGIQSTGSRGRGRKAGGQSRQQQHLYDMGYLDNLKKNKDDSRRQKKGSSNRRSTLEAESDDYIEAKAQPSPGSRNKSDVATMAANFAFLSQQVAKKGVKK